MKLFALLPIATLGVDFASTEFDVIQPQCGNIPTYEEAVHSTCETTNGHYTNGQECTIYCSTKVQRLCSCTDTIAGIITVLKANGCEWTGEDCVMETTTHDINTTVHTEASSME